MRKKLICGLDECGRGCLSGPVVAASVLYNEGLQLAVQDSKTLCATQRERLALLIKKYCPYGLGWVWPFEIDQINIHNASLLAMKRAYLAMPYPCEEAWIDGKFSPSLGIDTHTFVKGDQLHKCISAASIVAKTARDEYMKRYHRFEPPYKFNKHKGYPTNQHKQAIKDLGPSSIQRYSFKIENNKLQNKLFLYSNERKPTS